MHHITYSWMKTAHIITFLLSLIIGSSYVADGQTISQTSPFKLSIDTDFMQMRFNDAPNFRCGYDDYTQYAPGIALIGMKAFGVAGMTKIGRFAVSTAFSTALMVGVTNGIKYSVRRLRPDQSSHNSFPSGHTATSFLTATLLHKEYGWKYPWVSILGYSVATLTGATRILNNRHWMSDVVAGAAIGIGSVHLGYYLAGLIYKEKGLREEWHRHPFEYETERGLWGASLNCGRRFILGKKEYKDASILPFRGSSANAEVEIPLIPMTGITASVGCSSLTFRDDSSFNMYNALAGVYWSYPFARVMEVQAKAAIGYAWHRLGNGIDMQAAVLLNLFTGRNFKIKAFAEYETFSFSEQKPFLNSFLVGWSTGFCW